METCPDCGNQIPEDAPLGLCPVCLVSQPLTDDPAHVEADDGIVAGYRIIQKTGEGGFAIVYEAEQLEPVRRRVALKVLKSGVSSPQVLARFDAERQALALMDHPNIASIYDAGETAEGDPWFAMEFVKGGAITDFSREQDLTLEERLRILQSVCEAVQHAHLKGVLHRDIKPSNILITGIDGRLLPKVIDFGIARALDVTLTKQVLFTEFHQIVGTPGYMSPEQAALDNTPLDGRSDIYSLGILIYEILTGRQPFADPKGEKCSVPELLRRVREDDPPRLSHQNPALRGDIESVVHKAISKRSEDRYDSAGSLARELERVIENRPVQAAAPSNWYRIRKFVRRHRAPVIAAALAILALVAGATVSTVQYLNANQLSKNLQEREIELREEFRNSDFKLGLQFAARRRPGDAIAYFSRALRTDPEHHASASCLLSLLAHQKFNKATNPPIDYPDDIDTCHSPVIFEDDKSIISLVNEGGELAKWKPETGAVERFPTGFEAPAKFLLPIRSSSRFAIASEKRLEIRSIENPDKPLFQFELKSPLTSLVASTASNHLAGGCADGSATIWDTSPGQLSSERILSDSPITTLVLAREGSLLGYGTLSGEIGSWGVELGIQSKKTDVHQSQITALAISKSGSHMASGDVEGIVYLWRPRPLGSIAGPIYHGDSVELLRINSAYRKLMSGSKDGYARLWNMTDGSLEPPAQFHRTPVTFGTETSRFTEFITGGSGGALRIWSVVDGSGEAFPGAAQTTATAASFSMRYLATFSDRRRRVSLYEIDREPASIRRLSPGDGIDHTAEFGEVRPVKLTTISGDVSVRLTSNYSLSSKLGNGSGFSMRTLQPIEFWALREDAKQLAALTEGGKFVLWNPLTGEELSPPLRVTSATVKGMRFCESDSQIELLLEDNELARLEIPPPEPELPEWFFPFAEQMGGKQLSEDGVMRNLEDNSLQAVAGKLTPHLAFVPESPDKTANQYADWLLAGRNERTHGPTQLVKINDYVDQLLDTGDPIYIREALRFDPQNPRGVQLLKENAMRLRSRRP